MTETSNEIKSIATAAPLVRYENPADQLAAFERAIAHIDIAAAELHMAGMDLSDVDLFECNEAFAVVVLHFMRDIGLADLDRVNVNGGAIAIGHPIGASGARILTTLLHEMKRRDARRGLATLCIGGGMGVAMCLEQP